VQYLTLLGGDESLGPVPGTPEFDAMMAGYVRFGEVAGDAILGGEALEPAATSTTVRPDPAGGDALVTNGPFAETVEALGGFYVLEAASLDDAVALAREIPAAATGWVALRPMRAWSSSDGPAPAGGSRFFAVLYGPETAAHRDGTAEGDAADRAHRDFAASHADAVLAHGSVLPAETTTIVRVRDGEVQVTNGAAEPAAEVTGGVYVFGAPSATAAADLVAGLPVAPGGAVELRPIMELGA
jgi:hypothetical protein